MQTCLEFGFCVIFTIKYAEKSANICAILNTGYAYLLATLLIVSPVFCAVFYKMKFERFRQVETVNEIGDDSFIIRR